MLKVIDLIKILQSFNNTKRMSYENAKLNRCAAGTSPQTGRKKNSKILRNDGLKYRARKLSAFLEFSLKLSDTRGGPVLYF